MISGSPMNQPTVVICPFCGATQPSSEVCIACTTPLDASTRQETLARMGPWSLRSAAMPFMPGCSWAQLERFIERGVVTRETILRGPTTRQLWTIATRAPGVAHLFGVCHACQTKVDRGAAACPACRASFGAPLDRNHLGLPTEHEEPSAHIEGTGGARLSAFATNDELREGLHDEVRRRRSMGRTVDRAVPVRTAEESGRGAVPDEGSPTGGSIVSDPTGTGAARRLAPSMALGGLSLLLMAAIVVGAMVAIDGRGGNTQDSARTVAAGTDHAQSMSMPSSPGAGAEGVHARPSDAGPPLHRPISDDSGPETPANPSAVHSSATRSKAASSVPPLPTAPPTPASRATATDPALVEIDDLLDHAHDRSLARSERRRTVTLASERLDALLSTSTTPSALAALAERRLRLDEARRRLEAETFLRGE